MAAPKKAEKKESDESGIDKQPPGWDLMHEESKKILKDPTVVCQIRRSKNDNRVIYQANLIADPAGSGKQILNPQEPIKVFWLKIEPSYIQKNRKSGKKDDKTELTFLESNMAYGISWEIHGDAKNGEYKLIFVALKERPCILKIDPKDGMPKCFGKVIDDKTGQEVNGVLTDMYVHTKENWVGLPTVNYIMLYGYNNETKQKLTQKIQK